MIGTGKYDFPGIRKAGATAVKALIVATGWGAWIFASPFRFVADFILEWCMEWLANRGLLILNLGAIWVDGKIDQNAFDNAMETAIQKAQIPGLSIEEKRAIDEKVKEAFREFARIGNKR